MESKKMKPEANNPSKDKRPPVNSRATGSAKKKAKSEKTARMRQMQAYRFAFSLMDKAIRERFYIEAIALEESIISDRLNSIFDKLGLRPDPEQEVSFGGLTKFVKKHADRLPLLIERLAKANSDPSQLDEWREYRNQFVHEMVHGGDPETPGIRGGEYYSTGKEVAKKGKKFARIISDWARSESRRLEALSKGATPAPAGDKG